MNERAVPALDAPEPPIIDSEVSEPLLNYADTLAWLDEHAADWRKYQKRPPPPLFAFGKRWWDPRELREWIGVK